MLASAWLWFLPLLTFSSRPPPSISLKRYPVPPKNLLERYLEREICQKQVGSRFLWRELLRTSGMLVVCAHNYHKLSLMSLQTSYLTKHHADNRERIRMFKTNQVISERCRSTFVVSGIFFSRKLLRKHLLLPTAKRYNDIFF